MRIDDIKSKVFELMKDCYVLEENDRVKNKLMNYSDENLTRKDILRIRRIGINVDCWKTIVLVEIDTDDEESIKPDLKKAINWIVYIKESLLGCENSDLYLFLALNKLVSKEECLRIESTEKFCRKYVILPEEDITEFVNRTFLQMISTNSDIIEGSDPLERAFSRTVDTYKWLTPALQKKWKNALLNLNGSELIDVLFEDEVQV